MMSLLSGQNMGLFALTLGAFLVARFAYHKSDQHVLFQPLLIGVVLVVPVLVWLDIPYQSYFDANQPLQWLLGPAVVSLAIPLYHNLTQLRRWLPVICISIGVSALVGVLVTGSLAYMLDFDFRTQVALVTKSATTPIALSINEVMKGHMALAALVVMFTGLLGAMIGPALLNRFGFEDHRIQGVALGLTSHAIGTQKALEISPVCGAFSALAMIVTGVFLSVLLPLLGHLWMA